MKIVPGDTVGSASRLLDELKKHIRPDKAAFLPRFFKTGPGEYGEGDRFLGVMVPDQRNVARNFRTLNQKEMSRALDSPWHEVRLTALFIFVWQFGRADEKSRKELIQFYLQNTQGINNWDLVDTSAPQSLGIFVLENPKERRILYRLAKSKNLWEQRMAVVSTLPCIKQGEFGDILKLSEQFLSHKHDLIHKATGWMLREAGQRDLKVLVSFLESHSKEMPRTMLRYSIEKLPEFMRKIFMKR